MKKIIYIIFPLIVYAFAYADVAHAANCPESPADKTACEVVEGCVYSIVGERPVCNECSENKYYESTTDPDTGAITAASCEPCPDSHPKSAAGTTTGKAACYQTCETVDIAGGKKVPTDTKAYYNNDCAYTIQCNTTGNETCRNLGYHLNETSDACISDVSSCGYGKLKFYYNGWSGCYVSSCGEGETLIPKALCGTNTNYGECMKNSLDCSSDMAREAGLDTTKCTGGTISGTAQLNSNDTTYNFSSCTCQKGQPVTIDNGTAIETCHFSSDGQSLSETCSQKLQTCDSGYCSQNNQYCIQVPAGYYSVDTEVQCHQCPNGATSDAGSISKNACHYTPDTTFTDSSGGSFNLPADGDIAIKWNW